MALKTFKPYTKSTRGTILTSREGLWKGKPYKPLTSANYSSKGRNNYGRITSRNHGGGLDNTPMVAIALESIFLTSPEVIFIIE